MKNKNLLYVLSLALMMGACGKKQQETTENNDKFDTVRVINEYTEPQTWMSPTIKYFQYINTQGEIYDARLRASDPHMEIKDVVFIKRGDTIVLQGNKLIKNITAERLAYEYAFGR